ncbi:MAG: hypothetical protein CME31_02920 [Gimesia sp.]|uniref:Uncharacterized protein n=1 Tax=Gimesia maris TaxID=122 RepID=A0A3D3R6B8_9PLAN|nr:hypothetical protein [Gimesia sp.]HCO23622.1 hypothetical protein [Gimesia maris]
MIPLIKSIVKSDSIPAFFAWKSSEIPHDICKLIMIFPAEKNLSEEIPFTKPPLLADNVRNSKKSEYTAIQL